MRIIVDVNLAVRWADMLSGRGIETVHWAKIGAANAPDIEIMSYAKQNGYSVFTNDLDFMQKYMPKKILKGISRSRHIG